MVDQKVIIYGTSWWPYCNKAREAYGDKAVYLDIDADIKNFTDMLSFSGNQYLVPVIVEGEKVTIGFGGTSEAGKTWPVRWPLVQGPLTPVIKKKL